MKRVNILKRIINIYKEYREKNLISSYLKRRSKKIQINNVFKKNDHSSPFYRFFFDILLSGIWKQYLTKYIYPKILEEEEKKNKMNQLALLNDYLETIKNTKIAREYKIEQILKQKTNLRYELFKKQIPIFEYQDFKDYIQESKIKKDIIRPGKIKKFSASSWTTDNKKHIPVSNESLESASKAWIEMLAEYFTKNPNTKIFKWNFFPLTWSIQEHKNNITIADISALLILDRGHMSKNRYVLDLFYLLHPEREIKRELALKRINPNKPITMMWVTSRAYEILNYIQKTDPKMFDTMIKNMEVVFGGGVDVAPYMQYFKKLNLNYMWVYNASEWYFGYQDIINYDNSDGKSPYKLLTNHGIFYEFIEFNSDNFDENGNCKKTAKAKAIRDITKEDINKKFALIITTNSWLIRYMIWDVIQFVDQNHRYKITGRTRQSLNLKWEELMETHIANVIHELSDTDDINIIYYTIAPDLEKNPTRHERVIEIENKTNISEKELAQKIDKILQKVNADYQAKRKNNILLKLPKVTLVAQWSFYLRLKKSNRLGAQIKVPKLSTKRNYIEEILKIAQ
jgi:hypothetical protein